MRHFLILSTLILVSCGQEKKNEYEAGGLDKLREGEQERPGPFMMSVVLTDVSGTSNLTPVMMSAFLIDVSGTSYLTVDL